MHGATEKKKPVTYKLIQHMSIQDEMATPLTSCTKWLLLFKY